MGGVAVGGGRAGASSGLSRVEVDDAGRSKRVPPGCAADGGGTLRWTSADAVGAWATVLASAGCLSELTDCEQPPASNATAAMIETRLLTP